MVSTDIEAAPAARSFPAAAASVAPVVKTSSTSRILLPVIPALRRTENMFCNPLCLALRSREA